MGFGDKLKELRGQAQQAVAENKDRIQDAVQVVGDVANTRTNGRYANKIAKVGVKVEEGVDKFSEGAPAADQPQAAADQPQAAEADSSAAPVADAPTTPVSASAADEAASGFPEFE
ncbi:MAG TPA: Rv0909 family putative TA system antitoxin [Solirubrobacteraceae bacterium]|jgi:hypothetical protein|nr:Rv0909 family putative TA system antitoxin [Solirubrobacteraceae bacterium]